MLLSKLISTAPQDLKYHPIDVVMTSHTDNSVYIYNNLKGKLEKFNFPSLEFTADQKTLFVNGDILIFTNNCDEKFQVKKLS